MKKHVAAFIFIFAFSFLAGFYFLSESSHQVLSDREVASIHQFKLSNEKFLDTESLQKELNKKIKIYSVASDKVIALEGFSSQLCKSFSSIELFFEAYGVSVSGEAPEFKVTADCIAGQDPADIALIKIPVEKLTKEKAREAQFKFSNYRESYELSNSDEWAKTWLLSKIIFRSSSDSKIIKISNDRPSENSPIVLEF